MDDLIARQRPGVHPDDEKLRPIIGPDLVIRLAPDETARWWGPAEASMQRYDRSLPEGGSFAYVWSLVETAEVLITDRRVVYRANTLTRKPGFLVGLRAGVASGLAGGTPRLAPDAYAGQLRFEWVMNVMLRVQRRLGFTFASVMLTLSGTQAVPMRLVLTFQLQPQGMSESGIHAFAGGLANDIASHRRQARTATSEPVRTASGVWRWDIPGSQPFVPPVATPLAALAQAIDGLHLPA